MSKYFNCIGLAGNYLNKSVLLTHNIIYKWLIFKGYKVIIEKNIALKLKIKKEKNIGNLKNIGKIADLAIIVGGDGSMLNAARILSFYNIKVIGINRGNLGFLTDIGLENNIKKILSNILQGKFICENRFLLEIRKINKNYCFLEKNTAINEIILHTEKAANMIEFEVYIDMKFAFSQRSNGLIIATPTGSTAYCLSAGGPILSPILEAMVLVPIFPHTLSSRPLVISSNSMVQVNFANQKNKVEISCDSQINIPIKKLENILIKRSKYYLNLVHPLNYDYYNTLTHKLGWLRKLF